MKVLFCSNCGSMFSLSMDKAKSCDCGKVRGKYLNNRMAVTNGKGTAIGIGTGRLWERCVQVSMDDGKKDRGHYLDEYQLIAWVRPHEGNGNPHTKVVEDEQIET